MTWNIIGLRIYADSCTWEVNTNRIIKGSTIYSWEKLSLTRLLIASSADDDAIFCLAGIVRPLQIPDEYSTRR